MKKGEQRKQELLKIAYRMFIEKGYDSFEIICTVMNSNSFRDCYNDG